MKHLMCFVAAALAVGLVATASATVHKFTADFVAYDDPTFPNGQISGTMYYSYDDQSTTDFTRAIDYTVPANVKEAIVWRNATQYMRCSGKCSAFTYDIPAERFFKLNTDTSIGSDPENPGCTKYTRTGDQIQQISFKTIGDKLCAAWIQSNKQTRTYKFTNYRNTVDNANLTAWNKWNCPNPVCTRVMDLVLVLDQSSSARPFWDIMKNWAKDLLNKLDIRDDATHVGIVYFYRSAKLILKLTSNKQDLINALDTNDVKNSGTCIGCGIYMGLEVLDKSLRRSQNVPRVMILLTDGENWHAPKGDATKYFEEACDYMHGLQGNQQTQTIAIGVQGAKWSEILRIASDLNGEKFAYNVTWDALSTINDKIVKASCTSFGENKCGDGCQGFCGCSNCMCPTCPYINNCTINSCNTLNNGCDAKPKVCDDNNKCTRNECDVVTGCYFPNASAWCDDNNVCTIDKCDPKDNCTHTKIECLIKKCEYLIGCDPIKGCQYEPIPLKTGICEWEECTETTGIVPRTHKCNDTNKCRVGTCNPIPTPKANGDANDPCDYEEVICDDNIACTENKCDPKSGCYFPQKKCTGTETCKAYYCDESNGGECASFDINPCEGVCIDYPKDCNNRMEHPEIKKCQEGICVPDETGLNSTCDIIDKDCTLEDKCQIGKCDSAIGEYGDCGVPDVVECSDPPPCWDTKCNPATGECDQTKRVCPVPEDPCMVGYCDEQADQCRFKPRCSDHDCVISTCDKSDDGKTAQCVETTKPCDTGNECIIGQCIGAGECTTIKRVCPDIGKCKVTKCDSKQGCVYPDLDCDDGDPCTRDYCVEPTGCMHDPECVDDLKCTVDRCVRSKDLKNFTCTPLPNSCLEINNTGEDSFCFVSACNEKKGCHREAAVTAYIDVCGNCIRRDYGNVSGSEFNTTQEQTKCVSAMTWPKLAAGIGAAAVAAIIVAAIIAAVLLSVSGFFGTKELVKRAKQAQDQAAHNNPLYQDSGRELTNPAYAGNN